MYLNGVYSEYAPASYCYVHYDANGGDRDASAQAYDSNMAAVPMSRPTKDGYAFVGWYTQKVGGLKITSLDETTHGMTLYAHWEKLVSTPEVPTTSASGLAIKVTNGRVHTRTGPGVSYGIVDTVRAGDQLTITGTTEADDTLWGFYGNGWIDLKYTNYFQLIPRDEEIPEVGEPMLLPVYGIVLDPNGVIVFNGPHTTYPQKRTLAQNTQIQLLETMFFAGKDWVRYEGGWLQLNASILILDENALVHSFETTTNVLLTIRSGPGLDQSKVGNVANGTSVRVYAVTEVDGEYWGRIAKGWIHLGYTNFDADKLPQYQNHIYKDWYTASEGTCVTPGQERHDCKYCEHYELRDTELGEHSMGVWYTSQEATCVTPGQQQRDCQHCDYSETQETALADHIFSEWYETKAPTTEEAGEERRDCQTCEHYETRVLEPTEHIYGDWYVTVEPGCTEPGQERHDCQECEHYEVREVEAVGHSFGEWYESIAPTTTAFGQERRDCTACDHYETRETDKLPATTKMFATVTCGTLRVRSGPGSNYAIVAKIYKGDVVEVYETTTVNSVLWGRIDSGWIWLTNNTEISYEEDAHTHTLGYWYVTLEATATEHGEERRDCSGCDYYEIRLLEKLPVTVRTYATVTCDILRVRSGAGSGYSIVSKLYKGDIVEVYETTTVNSVLWGRIDGGWIWLTNNTKVSTVEEVHTHSFDAWYTLREASDSMNGLERRDCTGCDHYELRETQNQTTVTRVYATITCSALSIRKGAGTGFTRIGYYYKGDTVEILEQTQVGDMTWGRTEQGWICLTGYTTIKTVTETTSDATVQKRLEYYAYIARCDMR